MLEYPSPFAMDFLVSDSILPQRLVLRSLKQMPETVNIGTHSVHELFWNEVFRFCMQRIIAASLLSLTSNFHAQILLEIEFTLTVLS